jgi:hypothetical protein
VNAGELVRALRDRHAADWVLTTRDQDVGVVDEDGPVRRRESRTRWTLVVHDDVSNGRGSARVELAGHDGPATALVDQTLRLARAAVGVGWRSLPQAAPAKVELRDPALDVDDIDGAAADVLRGVPRPGDARVSASATVMRERVTVETKQGLRTSWTATHARVALAISRGDHSLAIAREARRAGALDLADAVESALADLAARGDAGAPVGGPCRLRLGADALLHGGGYGMWQVFASQADAVVERQGLTRYREGMLVAPGADQVTDPLAIASDGARDYGALSAPVGDDGDAVRRFAIVDRGAAAGLALGPREAALRKREPNGGLRDLVVSLGSAGDDDGGVVELRRLRSLAIDRYTGEASLEIGLAIDRRGATPRAFAGGTVRLDLVAALARARRAPGQLVRGPYAGPAHVTIDDAEVVV